MQNQLQGRKQVSLLTVTNAVSLFPFLKEGVFQTEKVCLSVCLSVCPTNQEAAFLNIFIFNAHNERFSLQLHLYRGKTMIQIRHGHQIDPNETLTEYENCKRL